MREKKNVKNPIAFQDEEEEEEKEGKHTKKRLGFTSVVGFRVATHEGKKKRKVAERDCKCVGAYKNDCHEYYALSSGASNDEIVLLFVTMSHKTS